MEKQAGQSSQCGRQRKVSVPKSYSYLVLYAVLLAFVDGVARKANTDSHRKIIVETSVPAP